jgi:hypothetical protein
MGNTTKKGNLTKSYLFKANLSEQDFKLWKSIVEEYQGYKEVLSKWVCDHLTTMKIGDILPYIDRYSKKIDSKTCKYPENTYYNLCEEHKDEPLYKIFQYDSNNRNNALYEVIRKTNCDSYTGNILNLSETYYRRNGFVKRVLANYATKILSMKPSVKKRKVTSDSTEEEIRNQVIYEIFKKNIKDEKDFKNVLEYSESKCETNKAYVERIRLLYDFYIKNKNEIKEYVTYICVEQLKEFCGVKVNRSKSSMNINIQNFSITRVDGKCTYILHLPIGKKVYDIKLWGNRQVVMNTDGTPVDIIDIINRHGESIDIVFKNGDIYFTFVVSEDFKKDDFEIGNVVGVDVNTKHMLMQTNIVDNGNVDGFFNIYKELVNDKEFSKCVSKEDLELFKELSNYVSFCPIECQFLFTRYAEQKGILVYEKLRLAEKNLTSVLDRSFEKYNDIDCNIANYISNVRMLRSKCKSYFTLKMKYKELQHKYDDEMGYVDTFSDSCVEMDLRRKENPFVLTNEAMELLGKMESVSQDIIGCRDNIIAYAYNVFRKNGYDTVGLENLESSQFERFSSVISPKSLLNYHHLKGKHIDFIDSDECSVKVNKDLYNFTLEDDGTISDITLSDKGKYRSDLSMFYNQIIKTIHFADIKDKFIQLGNNGNVQTVLVPSYFTSQMNSKTHKIYVVNVKNEKTGKIEPKLANKNMVRLGQEHHINGLNADVNASMNIAYIAENEKMRKTMCKDPKSETGYSVPFLTSRIKKQSDMVVELKKMGMVEVLSEKTAEI